MSLIDLIGWRATGMRNRLADRLWEHRLHVRTTGHRGVEGHDVGPYSTFAYSAINRILDELSLTPDDVFIDIGCGKGRVVCCAARRGIKQVIGVDIDEELCATARSNAEHLAGRHSPVQI